MQYLLLIYANEAEADKMREAGMKEMMDAYRSFTQSIIEKGNFKAGDAPAADLERHHRAGARRQDADDRRAVRRDPRAARRLLPDRGEGPRRGDMRSQRAFRRPSSARSRCGRSGLRIMAS